MLASTKMKSIEGKRNTAGRAGCISSCTIWIKGFILDHYPKNGHNGFSPLFLIKMAWHGDRLPRASGAERIVFLQYNMHGRLSFSINLLMVMVMVTRINAAPQTQSILGRDIMIEFFSSFTIRLVQCIIRAVIHIGFNVKIMYEVKTCIKSI